MKQLSGMDNMFLHLEHGNQYMHVAGLGIYDPSTAPGGFVRFKDILKFFEARLDSSPVFRRRLIAVPMDLDRPYWIEDAEVDVEYHVRHIALPYPGDWRQLCIQVARIHSRPLDRSKPLWEAYVIEGLDNIPGIPKGSFAFYTKFHHAAIDGEGGTEVMRAIHSFSVEEADRDEGPRRSRVRDREPTQIELYTRALVNNVQRVPRAARFSLQTATRLAGIGSGYMGQLKELLQQAGVPSVETVRSKLRRPPVTRFSGKVSAHRVVELVGVPMADIRKVRQKIDGATINDIFMTTVGGALNKYLDAKGELPDRSMTAQIPMTLRGEHKGKDEGNHIGVAVMPLHTEIAAPLERLQRDRPGGRQGQGDGRPRRQGPDQACLRPAAGGGVGAVHEEGHVADDEHRRLERPRSGRADVPGRRADGGVRARQHRDGRARPQHHRLQLPRHAVDVRGGLPRHDSGSRVLRRLPARKLCGPRCRSRQGPRERGSARPGRQAQIAGAQAVGLEEKDRREGCQRRVARIAQAPARPPEDRMSALSLWPLICFGAAKKLTGDERSFFCCMATTQRSNRLS